MLGFSRKSEGKMAEVNLNDLIERSIEMVRKDFELRKYFDFRQVKLEKNFDPRIKTITCLENELEQVLLNLLKNAAYAFEAIDDERTAQITIKTGLDSDHLTLEVTDNGIGMSENVKRRLFEPFFTTKPVGVGTGLGLSVSFAIITNNHKGNIRVESEKGKGTTFVVRLPLHQ